MWTGFRQGRLVTSQIHKGRNEMSTETNKAKARELQEIIDRLDYDTWRAALGKDFVATANGGEEMNAEQFEGMARGFMDAFSNSRHIFESQVAEGDWVASRMTWTGVHTGTFNGIPASNRPVSIAIAAFDRIRDGKVVEHRASFDAMGLMVQIGAIPMAA
jgi:predicted ester cyclase